MRIPSLVQVERELFKRSYFEFFSRAVKELEPNTEWKFNWHVEYLCNTIQRKIEKLASKEKVKDLNVNVPPGTSKSYIFSRVLCAWAWLKYPFLKFAVTSSSYSLSTMFTTSSRYNANTATLLSSQFYQDLNPDLIINYGESGIGNNKGGVLAPKSLTSTVTGEHYHVIIADDLLDAGNSRSSAYLTRIKEYYFSTLASRKSPDSYGGLMINVQQRLVEEDITGEIKSKNLDYNHIILPAIKSKDILPGELSKNYVNGYLINDNTFITKVKNQKITLGSLQFEGQYQQSPAPIGGSIFKKDWFNQRFNPNSIKTVKNFVSDTAYGQKTSDNSATLCYSIHDNNLYIHNIWKVNLEFPDYIDQFPQFVLSNGYSSQSRCYFEPKATGHSVIQQLKRDTGLNVIADKSPVEAKETRALSVSAFVESGRVFFANGVNWEDFIGECLVFPNGKNDDQVDVLIMALHKLQIQKKQGIKKINKNGWSSFS